MWPRRPREPWATWTTPTRCRSSCPRGLPSAPFRGAHKGDAERRSPLVRRGSQPSLRRMATAAPMTAARITPVCASMAPANRHVRRASSSVGCLSDGGRDGVGEWPCVVPV